MNMSLEGADSKALRAAVEGLKEKFTFGVAIDGSSMSFKALDLVCKLITERAEGKAPKVEKLHCLHVENPHKQEALSLKSEHFRHTAKLRIDKEPHIEMRWHHSHVDKSSRDSEGHVGIFSLLEGMAMEHGLDLLVQRGYFFAMDGLSASSKALIFVTKYLMRKQDKIYLFYKNTHAEVKGIFKNYMELLGGLGLNYQTIFSSDKTLNVAEEIVSLSSKLECEFIVMGKKRMRQDNLLGSITDHVAAKSRSSIIICKDGKF